MGSHEKFWVAVWSLALVFVLGFFAICSAYYAHKNQLKLDLAARGMAAQDIVCLLGSESESKSSDNLICVFGKGGR